MLQNWKNSTRIAQLSTLILQCTYMVDCIATQKGGGGLGTFMSLGADRGRWSRHFMILDCRDSIFRWQIIEGNFVWKIGRNFLWLTLMLKNAVICHFKILVLVYIHNSTQSCHNHLFSVAYFSSMFVHPACMTHVLVLYYRRDFLHATVDYVPASGLGENWAIS